MEEVIKQVTVNNKQLKLHNTCLWMGENKTGIRCWQKKCITKGKSSNQTNPRETQQHCANLETNTPRYSSELQSSQAETCQRGQEVIASALFLADDTHRHTHPTGSGWTLAVKQLTKPTPNSATYRQIPSSPSKPHRVFHRPTSKEQMSYGQGRHRFLLSEPGARYNCLPVLLTSWPRRGRRNQACARTGGVCCLSPGFKLWPN